MTVPVVALPAANGAIRVTADLDAVGHTVGSASNSVALIARHANAGDCNHTVRLPVGEGEQTLHLAMTITSLDCPTLFAAHPGTLQATIEIASASFDRMGGFDLTTRLHSVDVFFASATSDPGPYATDPVGAPIG